MISAMDKSRVDRSSTVQDAGERQAAEWLATYFRTGDRDSLQSFLLHYQSDMFSFASHVLGRHADAEDAVQKACLEMLRKPVDVSRIHSVRGWVLGIVRNVCLMQIRESKRRAKREDKAVKSSEDSSTPVDQTSAEQTELREAILKQIRTLPDKYRWAVILRYYQGVSDRDAAELLGEQESTLRMQISRALVELRTRLSANGLTLSAAALSETMTKTQWPTVPARLTEYIIEFATTSKAVAAGTRLPSSATSSLIRLAAGTAAIAALVVLASAYQQPEPTSHQTSRTDISPDRSWSFETRIPEDFKTLDGPFAWKKNAGSLQGVLVCPELFLGLVKLPIRLTPGNFQLSIRALTINPALGRIRLVQANDNRVGASKIWKRRNRLTVSRSTPFDMSWYWVDGFTVMKIDDRIYMLEQFETPGNNTQLYLTVRGTNIDAMSFNALSDSDIPKDVRDAIHSIDSNDWSILPGRATHINEAVSKRQSLPVSFDFNQPPQPDQFEVLRGPWKRVESLGSYQGKGLMLSSSKWSSAIKTNLDMPSGPCMATARICMIKSGTFGLTLFRTDDVFRATTHIWRRNIKLAPHASAEIKRYWLGNYGFVFINGKLTHAERCEEPYGRHLIISALNIAVDRLDIKALTQHDIPVALRDPETYLRKQGITLSTLETRGRILTFNTNKN